MAEIPASSNKAEFNNRSIGVLAVSLLGMTVSFSPAYVSTLPILMKGIGAEFGWDRTTVMSGHSAPLLAIFVVPFIGRMIDRIGPRVVILACTAVFGTALLSLSFMGPYYLLFLFLSFLIGVAGGSGAGPVGYISLLSRWFDRRLGASIGIANMGVGLGTMLMPIIAQRVDAAYGWRWAFAAISVLILSVALPAALAFARTPDCDGRAYGPARNEEAYNNLSTREIFRMPVFWAICASSFLVMLAVAGCAAHLFPMMTDRGYSGSAAAEMVALLGFSLLVARLLSGLLLDFIPSWLVGTVTFTGVALGAFLLGTSPSTSLAVPVILIGAGQGIEGDLLPFLIRRIFGTRNFGTCYGMIIIPFSAGGAIGPIIAAQFFDRGFGYTAAFHSLTISALLSAVIMAVPIRRSLDPSKIGLAHQTHVC